MLKRNSFYLWETFGAEYAKSLDFHPKWNDFQSGFNNGEILEKDYYSVGGGFVATQEDNSIESHCIRTPYPLS